MQVWIVLCAKTKPSGLIDYTVIEAVCLTEERAREEAARLVGPGLLITLQSLEVLE